MKAALIALALTLGIAAPAYADRGGDFDTRLQPFNLNGLPVDSNATGTAKVEVIDGGTAIKFRVNVAGIRNLTMAHIHIAPQPVEVTDPAGPVAFWFVGGPPSGANLSETINGRLAEGFIVTNGDVVNWSATDPLSGTVEGLIKAIEEGRASVIVHTNDLNPATTALVAGDSPGGELRGTLH